MRKNISMRHIVKLKIRVRMRTGCVHFSRKPRKKKSCLPPYFFIGKKRKLHNTMKGDYVAMKIILTDNGKKKSLKKVLVIGF